MQQGRLRTTTPTASFKPTRWVSTSFLCLVVFCIGGGIGVSDAWSFVMPTTLSRRTARSPAVRLFSSRKDEVSTTKCAVRRLGLTGVSVSEGGFAVLWGLVNASQEKVYWPWYVTTPQAGDKNSVTSAQALTLCQLIAGIDLAGSRLPADLLAQVTVLSCEREGPSDDLDSTAADLSDDSTTERLMADIQGQVQRIHSHWFPKESETSSKPQSYSDAPRWIRARVRLPVCTLDQIIVEPDADKLGGLFHVSLHVQVRGYGSLVLHHVTDPVLTDALEPLYDDYTFSDDTRRAFLTTALSLRYKAPVLLEHDSSADEDEDNDLFVKEVTQAFPLYTTVAKVQTPSDRVVSHIEKSWEVHQLQAAYQIAIKKKDLKAVAKIRAKLDEMEEMSELPVQADSELDSME